MTAAPSSPGSTASDGKTAQRPTRTGRARRARTPTVLQMEAVECGAASLSMILGHFGLYLPLEQLRAECGVSRDGSKAANILKVARRHGLTAKGFRRSPDAVLAGPFPSVVFWNFNHFLVVEGASKTRVFLNDPAMGPRSVSHAEFASAFSVVVLTFEKSETFRPGGTPPQVLTRLSREAGRHLQPLLFVLFLGALVALPNYLIPGFTIVFVDDILVHDRGTWLTPLLLIMAAAIVIQVGLAALKEATLLRLEMRMALGRSMDFVWHVLRLQASFFGQRYLGDVASRVVSVVNVAHLLAADLGGALVHGVTVAIVLVLLALIDPALALISMVGALVNVAVLRALHRARADTAIRLQNDQGKLFATSVIGLQTIETLKATGAEDDFFSKWAGYHTRYVGSEQRLSRLEQAYSIVPPLTTVATIAVALGVGGFRVIDGVLALGALLAYQTLFSSLSAPIQQIVVSAGNSQQAAADLARLDDVFKAEIDWRHRPPPTLEPVGEAIGEPVGEAAHEPVGKAVHEPHRAPRARTEGEGQRRFGTDGETGLRLSGLTFGYSTLDPPLMKDLDLHVAPGGWVALVGGSGSGKSTLGKLISGLYTPWSGTVLLDGRPLAAYDRKTLAGLIAVVEQSVTLFEGTVQDNITLWDGSVPFEAVVEAARDAQLLDIVERMPGSFGAAIEEGGRNLSGGQRQRIEIARGLAHRPSLLVLDEATSALDPVTELAVMDNLRRRHITCVVVAHRLSTIRDCDEILVLDDGEIVERGPHDALMAREGAYARLIAEGDAT